MSEEAISHISIKPAEFSEPNASGWFTILEAQFKLGKVTNASTQFYHCLAALPASVVNKLSKEVVDGEDYDGLKGAVLGLVESSRPELFESLLSSETLVGRPSACLSVMQKTASKVGVGDEFVRHKFLNSLPPTISPVLAAQPTLSLAQLGTLADELVTFTKANAAPVSQVSAQSQPSRNFSNSVKYHPSVKPFHSEQRPRVCRSHIYFANEARTCRSWCKWPDKTSCKVQPNSRANSPAPSTHSNRFGRIPNDEGTL